MDTKLCSDPISNVTDLWVDKSGFSASASYECTYLRLNSSKSELLKTNSIGESSKQENLE
jgi:hypothetical protein